MPQVINTNLLSMNAQRNLTTSGADLATSLQRLSSGLRINSAKDDAAGLAIANRMTSQIRGLNQASRNANDGISLAQTAEGGLGSVTNNLQRIRELAVQSANATNSATDRAALNAEAAQLIAEIDRVASTSSFNGVKLLDGTFTAQQFQVGADANQTITVSSIASSRTSDLGASYAAQRVGSALDSTDTIGAGDLIINGVTLGAVATTDAKDLATAINALSGTNVTASAAPTSVAGTSMVTAALTGTITINGVATASFAVGGGTLAADRTAVTAAIQLISGATGVSATNTGADATGVTLSAADGRNVDVSFSTLTAAATGVGATAVYESAVTLDSTGSGGITLTTTGTIANTGFTALTTAATLTGTSIANVDLTSVQGANVAITSVDSALDAINSSRGDLGAIQSRFGSVVSNLATTVENLSAARSRILDADFAAETAALTRSQILQQAGVSVLSQANASPQLVLSLLQ